MTPTSYLFDIIEATVHSMAENSRLCRELWSIIRVLPSSMSSILPKTILSELLQLNYYVKYRLPEFDGYSKVQNRVDQSSASSFMQTYFNQVYHQNIRKLHFSMIKPTRNPPKMVTVYVRFSSGRVCTVLQHSMYIILSCTKSPPHQKFSTS